MRRIFPVLVLGAIAACISASGQTPTTDDWVGIWHADPEAQPTGPLTLAADTGQLGGTVVLNGVSREGGQEHLIAREPHVLLNPQVDGNTLLFDVKVRMMNGSIVVGSFKVTRTAPDKATIRCISCGNDAPVVPLVKSQ